MLSCEKLNARIRFLLILLFCSYHSITTAREQNEQLQALPPPGWQQTYRINNEDMRLIDFAPTAESGDDDTKLSFEAHRQIKTADPIQVILEEIEKLKKICSFVSSSNIYSGLENGYPTSVRFIECGENAHYGKGEISILKTIQGKAFFYFVRFTRRIEPFAVGQAKFDTSSVAKWSTYLKQVSLCDELSHPCVSQTLDLD